MNLILFDQSFEESTLPPESVQALHIRRVLRAQLGMRVFLGFVNGPRARAEVIALAEDGSVTLRVLATEPSPPALPITLLVGLPRPHTAKRILSEAASLGVSGIHFFESERSEPSYALSSLWQTDAWRERVRHGVEQSFTTSWPEVAMHADLQSAISALYGADFNVVLDNYEAAAAIGSLMPAAFSSAVIAVGSERGWSAQERSVFIKNGWKLAHMGAHVLRAETACVAAVAAVASKAAWWSQQTQTQL